MVGQLINKPKDVTYTQMSIWLDANFYNEDCDFEKAYIYLWCLSYMVACKRHYFKSSKDYEGFASFMAYDVFKRRHNEKCSKLKSSLNYIKSVASFRRVTYEKERHQELFNEYVNWDNDKYLDTCRSALEKANHQKTEDLVKELLADTPHIIKRNIPKVFRNEPLLFQNIYTSCLLTFINQITLGKDRQAEYTRKLEDPNFNEAQFLGKYTDNDYIMWHLDDAYKTVVQVTINKTKNYMLEQIKEILADTSLTYTEFNDLMNSSYGDNNDLCNDN